ncbi:siderophore ABC transporter substrate-binding protein [Neisseria iguanae]|uniref:Iron ABC transporter substrate-binding protein n=1 Tax=Neisseria iguanae TaxID=90242 RepID=A0A2P7TZ93_9NEIS|nr:siderophore ABC transporter substrate-binding protein [Neisseria iguanae]PSJ80050.1 iron ABC transporter substrate-binding protein [Neisseria iguanae]
MLRLTFLAACCALALSACSPEKEAARPAAPAASAVSAMQTEGAVLTVKTTRGDVQVPQNPERVAVYDLGMADTLQKLGVQAGMSVANTKNLLPYLGDYLKNTQPAGTLFEPDFEALNSYKPQLIIIGSRAAKAFDQLNTIAPTIEMTAKTDNMKESAKERIDAFGQIFGKQTEADTLKAEIDASFDAAKKAAEGKGNGLVIIVNGGKISAYGPTSRLGGWIHKDIGVPAVDEAIKEGRHGQPITFEYLKEKNPDWLFVLDRGAAIGEEGQAAKDVLDNPLVAETNAWKKGQVVYLVPETYLAAGGAQELLNASKQLTDAFNTAK